MTFDADNIYLVMAMNGGCGVADPQARASLQKLGYMVPAKLRERFGGNPIPHGVVLTKKGQKRAKEIAEQLTRDTKAYWASRNRRGHRGAAWPKSWKISTTR